MAVPFANLVPGTDATEIKSALDTIKNGMTEPTQPNVQRNNVNKFDKSKYPKI